MGGYDLAPTWHRTCASSALSGVRDVGPDLRRCDLTSPNGPDHHGKRNSRDFFNPQVQGSSPWRPTAFRSRGSGGIAARRVLGEEFFSLALRGTSGDPHRDALTVSQEFGEDADGRDGGPRRRLPWGRSPATIGTMMSTSDPPMPASGFRVPADVSRQRARLAQPRGSSRAMCMVWGRLRSYASPWPWAVAAGVATPTARLQARPRRRRRRAARAAWCVSRTRDGGFRPRSPVRWW